MTWKLQAITGELTGQEVDVVKDMLVGRSQDADLVLQSAEISRRHAAFLLKEDALWVQDLGSSNGTFVNDIRIDHETLLKDQDIVQFASLKFSVLAPVVEEDEVQTVAPVEVADEPVVQTATEVHQPAEAVATAEVASTESTEETAQPQQEPTAAQQMNEQGMPSLTERSNGASVDVNGMPQKVSVPKPAPIPEGVDVHAVAPEPKPVAIPEPETVAEQQTQERKNASLGLVTIVILVILAVIAWLFFK
ncbi:FHA domain-containing protein [Acinetobacter gerneri]|uniref:FHA domain-containing protein n=1 Tax=Acinetobacter gerneri TaxID=202952 RepID=UPI003215C605